MTFWEDVKQWGLMFIRPTAIEGERELFKSVKGDDRARMPPNYSGRLRAIRVRLAATLNSLVSRFGHRHCRAHRVGAGRPDEPHSPNADRTVAQAGGAATAATSGRASKAAACTTTATTTTEANAGAATCLYKQ